MANGSLYLLPSGLGGAPRALLPDQTLQILEKTEYFIVEDAKTASMFLKSVGYPKPLQSARMASLNEHTRPEAIAGMLEPILGGLDGALLSDAGCPAVADPGARLVREAHASGIRVVPLVGPSAILLAVMASGMNGQRFQFHGYLPVDAVARRKSLITLEQESSKNDVTQAFIETPYRNRAMYEAILSSCQPNTLLCVATDLTCQSEYVSTRSISAWRSADAPDLERRPTVFLIYRGRS